MVRSMRFWNDPWSPAPSKVTSYFIPTEASSLCVCCCAIGVRNPRDCLL